MHVDTAFPSKYLRASDLGGKTAVVVIDHYLFEQVGGDNKLILYFRGKTKGLVTNKTNAQTIATSYGPEMDNWEGGELHLFTAMVDFQGKQTEAIRVRIPPRTPAPAAPRPQAEVRFVANAAEDARVARAAPPARPTLADDLNDEIPF